MHSSPALLAAPLRPAVPLTSVEARSGLSRLRATSADSRYRWLYTIAIVWDPRRIAARARIAAAGCRRGRGAAGTRRRRHPFSIDTAPNDRAREFFAKGR